jgi:pyruvate dehydrogenase E2 component (dihydrolipoamide acetyltransferase)
MSVEFRMPSLGPDMEAGTLVEWRVSPGTAVHRGDVMALVETEKGIIDVEIFHDGTVEQLLVAKGAHVPVGTVLAILSGDAHATSRSASAREEPVAAASSAASPVVPVPPPAAAAAESASHPKVSPAARARARALGVDLQSLQGTGPGGVITLADVERLAAPPSPSRAPQVAMRHAIAAAMSRANREIPHYYLASTIDFTPLRARLEAINRSRAVEQRVLYAAAVIRAVAHAAREIPGFNGHYRDETFVPSVPVHVGVAVAQRGGGLVAPALLDAADKTLDELMTALSDLVARARGGHLRASELSLATITVTSLGEGSVETVFPVIFPDQVAIVGVGSPTERPWIVDGKVTARWVLNLSLAGDHRVSDGRAGARFLERVAARIVAEST